MRPLTTAGALPAMATFKAKNPMQVDWKRRPNTSGDLKEGKYLQKYPTVLSPNISGT